MLLFLLSNWRIVAFAATIAVLSATAGFYKWRANVWETRYQDYVAEVRAAGIVAQVKAKETEAKDKERKKVADENQARTLAALRADNKRLRESRSHTVYLPAAAPASPNPDRITFDRAELESAIKRLDEGVSGIAEKGDEGIAGLNVAKEWVSGRMTGQ